MQATTPEVTLRTGRLECSGAAATTNFFLLENGRKVKEIELVRGVRRADIALASLPLTL
jgi:hypothetical protein